MNKNIESQVKKIIDDVRKNGDAAVSRYLWKLDGIKISPGRFRVRDERIKNASSQVDRKLAIALKSAAENIRRFHIEESRRSPGSWQCRKNGITMGQYVRPVEKAGLYVPGGRYCYPSTVLMTAIPARIAGVKEIILVTPPKNITPELLCASKIAGVDRFIR
jgi:histidinol dehydrogenase